MAMCICCLQGTQPCAGWWRTRLRSSTCNELKHEKYYLFAGRFIKSPMNVSRSVRAISLLVHRHTLIELTLAGWTGIKVWLHQTPLNHITSTDCEVIVDALLGTRRTGFTILSGFSQRWIRVNFPICWFIIVTAEGARASALMEMTFRKANLTL